MLVRTQPFLLAFPKATLALALAFLTFNCSGSGLAQEQSTQTLTPASVLAEVPSKRLEKYFIAETEKIASHRLADYQNLEQWQSERADLHNQLMDMLGLSPAPEKTPLNAQVTHQFEYEDIHVENVHFQSRPGLYVTGNLYRPKEVTEKLPTILYVCGHGAVKEKDVSFGNKVHYHHHGVWFAKHGYVCLTIDSLQLGEIEGIHHGTHRYGMWWWLNRGYTPAGVEAWNCIRALDYLETRPEVDSSRFGVTGRSGGGAYSWWIAAIDDRIKCAVPVAGITDMENHVVDDCIEGHCDCMFFVNRYRWDFAKVAALVAPRPLMISNSDNDSIFPLDGVIRVHRDVIHIYDLYGASESLGLNITPGPHQDTEDLRTPAYRWFEKHLKGNLDEIDPRSPKPFSNDQLQVFRAELNQPRLPSDSKNASIHETFVKPLDAAGEINSIIASDNPNKRMIDRLKSYTFRGWPEAKSLASHDEVEIHIQDELTFTASQIETQDEVKLMLFLVRPKNLLSIESIDIQILDHKSWPLFASTFESHFPRTLADLAKTSASNDEEVDLLEISPDLKDGKKAIVYFAPRGIGFDDWKVDEREQFHIRRRFHLLGQTLDGMRIWDICRAIELLGEISPPEDCELSIHASGKMAALSLYAALFSEDVDQLQLTHPPSDHRNGPYLLDIDRVSTLPIVAALVAGKTKVKIDADSSSDWASAVSLADELNKPQGSLVVQKDKE